MKQKINILIVTSVLALVALSAIQGYLIYNTYQLKKDVFIKETKESILGINNTKEMDSITELWHNHLTKQLAAYKKNSIVKKDAIEYFKPYADSLNDAFNMYYQNEIEKINLGFSLKLKKTITSIIAYDKDKIDTIFNGNEGSNYFLFGENFPHKEGNVIRKSRWFTEHDYEQENEGKMFNAKLNLEIKTEDSMSIIDWKKIVFSQMATLFLFSVFLFLFVVLLLFYSIKTLIRQKRIADVRNDFINNITHELKTPLATLGIASKSLRNKDAQNSPDIFENALDILDRQNNRLQKIIDQVMSNTLGSEEISLQKEKISDKKYLQEVVEDFKLSVIDKPVKVDTKFTLKKVTLTIDRFLFTTALLNILDNAVKYGKEDVQITIQTEFDDNAYKILIKDNGVGISEKEYQRIFEKFYRVTTGNVHDVKGLGLGLFYTNQVVKAHKGSITIESKLDKGTTFIISIPIQ
ncbi:HAMP domain-containing sensor histidine kinase [Aquimarina sp. 2201CG1-2-11]|uniref:sensor histidine kinase n=1 Tax=Aquimarina discodermiae TaxID=3231043 RepID=UPI0034630615